MGPARARASEEAHGALPRDHADAAGARGRADGGGAGRRLGRDVRDHGGADQAGILPADGQLSQVRQVGSHRGGHRKNQEGRGGQGEGKQLNIETYPKHLIGRERTFFYLIAKKECLVSHFLLPPTSCLHNTYASSSSSL